jgi:hypothetical protein
MLQTPLATLSVPPDIMFVAIIHISYCTKHDRQLLAYSGNDGKNRFFFIERSSKSNQQSGKVGLYQICLLLGKIDLIRSKA